MLSHMGKMSDHKVDLSTPGGRIRAQRLQFGWSQDRLAEEIGHLTGAGLTRSTVGQWERNEIAGTEITAANLIALSAVLRVEPAYIVYGATWPKRFPALALGRDRGTGRNLPLE
jgi:transcriptional regulator with XRE-family HTH domain